MSVVSETETESNFASPYGRHLEIRYDVTSPSGWLDLDEVW